MSFYEPAALPITQSKYYSTNENNAEENNTVQ